MNWRRLTTTSAAVLFAGLFVGGLVATPTASAAITASSITTPANHTFFINNNDIAAQTYSISGTTLGGNPAIDQVDINCYHGTTFTGVASGVHLNSDGSFSVPTANLATLEDGPCTLRAIPAGTTPSPLTPFAGPTIGVGESDTQAFDYYIWGQQLTGAFDYVSLGRCGLDDGYLFDPTSALTTTTFDCNAGLLKGESSAPTRSELQIDGANAYPPYEAESINSAATGLPALSYSYNVDPATGNLVIHETDPLVKCDPTYPPNSTSCATFLPTGVTDNVTITQDHDGHVAWFSEVFTGTDGHAHTLDLLWDNSERFQNGSGDSTQLEFEFPGQSTYSMHSLANTVALPSSSPATILVRMHGAADGDVTTGQGAIVYDRPATGATFTGVGTGASEFTLHQTGTIPAGGSTRFRFAYVQDYLAANVASLAQTASTAFLNPLTVSKAGTGSGTVTSSPAGISCGSACSRAYSYGTSVILTATPSKGSAFTGWSGACTGTGTCTVTTNDNTVVTATFGFIQEALTVSRKGDGKGTVTSSPDGISCGKTCRNTFDYGSFVILSAKAAKGSSFGGWSGACKSKKKICPLSLTAARSVKAAFLRDCVVPKVTGKTLKAARRAITSHNCAVGKVKQAFSVKVKKGRVISQKPKPRKRLKHGAKVSLVVSKG